jgi:hypothetical protein
VPEYSLNQETMPAAVSLTPDVLHIGEDAKWVFRLLRLPVAEHLGLGLNAYVEAFERWQLILRAAASDLRITHNTVTGNFSPYMRIDCVFPPNDYSLPAMEELHADVLRTGPDHPFLSRGLFGGELARFEAALVHATEDVLRMAKSLDEIVATSGPGGFATLPSGLHFPGTRASRPDIRPLPGP